MLIILHFNLCKSNRFETPKNTESVVSGQPKTPRKERGNADETRKMSKKVDFEEKDNSDNKENKSLSIKQIKEILDKDLTVFLNIVNYWPLFCIHFLGRCKPPFWNEPTIKMVICLPTIHALDFWYGE